MTQLQPDLACSSSRGLQFSCHYDVSVPSAWPYHCSVVRHCLHLSVLSFTSSYLNCQETQIPGLGMNRSTDGLPQPGARRHLSSRSRTQAREGSLDRKYRRWGPPGHLHLFSSDPRGSVGEGASPHPPDHASLKPELAPWRLRHGREPSLHSTAL